MADDLDATSIPFRLRGIDGRVTVRYGVNEDPVRWGYPVLQLPWARPELVRGFPVIQATVAYPAEGYAADMGWLQVVRYEIRDPGEEERSTVFDVPPQLADLEMPYAAFGVRPTFFDAPSTDAKDVTWDADTFLVYSPDAVMSRVLRPICMFTVGLPGQPGERPRTSIEPRRRERLGQEPPGCAGAVPQLDLRRGRHLGEGSTASHARPRDCNGIATRQAWPPPNMVIPLVSMRRRILCALECC